MLIVYLAGGQEVRIEGATHLQVEHGEQFVGTDEPSVLSLGDEEIVLARFKAGAVIGFREVPDSAR